MFASIFAFVTSFPSAPPQNNNQFQANEVYTTNQSYVGGIRILHLAGPAVPGSAFVYLKSSNDPTAAEFANPYTVSSGLAGSSLWNLGQTWVVTFTAPNLPSAHDNITVYIVSQSILIFSVILPGTSIVSPPTIVSTTISPAVPAIGQSFTVYAVLAGSYTANSVYVNLASVPGGPPTSQKMTLNGNGQWTYTMPGGASTNGTFYGFVNATGQTGQQAIGSVSITISAAGGTSNGPFSVGIILVPTPANTGSTEAVQAVVTYTGVLGTPEALNVSFTAISNPYVVGNRWTGWAPSGASIVGGTSVTVVSKTTWTVPANPATGSSFTVYANATVATVGTVPGTMTFTPAYLSLSASSGLIGSSITATGADFVGDTPVTFTESGVTATISACSSDISFTATAVTTTAAGGFVCTIATAANTPDTATTMIATDTATGQNDTAAFAVNDWTISPLNPTSGLIGSSVTVTGANFAGASSVTLTMSGISLTPTSCSSGSFSGPTITTTAAGGFVCVIKVPSTVTAGSNPVTATSAAWGATATAPFTVTAWSMVLSPTSGLMASSVTVTSTGFAASSSVTLAYNGISLSTTAPVSLACTVGSVSGSTITASPAGAFTCTYNVPYGATAGLGTLVASDASGPTTVSATYTVTPWTLTVSPTSASATTTLTFTGAGFAGSTEVSITETSPVSGALAVKFAACSSGTIGTNDYSVTTTAAGGFVCTFSWTAVADIQVITFTASDYVTAQVAYAYFSDTD